jgi:catechol 2,3-dioxygenase-like lactoylglutathione lyase family enzyme
MKYLHTMVRVSPMSRQSLRFYREGLGLEEARRTENEKGRYHADLPAGTWPARGRPGGTDL